MAIGMNANFGGYNPAQYIHRDDTYSRIGDRFANVAASAPALWRQGEQWRDERNARAANEAEMQEAAKRLRMLNDELVNSGHMPIDIPEYHNGMNAEHYVRKLADAFNAVISNPDGTYNESAINMIMSAAGRIGAGSEQLNNEAMEARVRTSLRQTPLSATSSPLDVGLPSTGQPLPGVVPSGGTAAIPRVNAQQQQVPDRFVQPPNDMQGVPGSMSTLGLDMPPATQESQYGRNYATPLATSPLAAIPTQSAGMNAGVDVAPTMGGQSRNSYNRHEADSFHFDVLDEKADRLEFETNDLRRRGAISPKEADARINKVQEMRLAASNGRAETQAANRKAENSMADAVATNILNAHKGGHLIFRDGVRVIDINYADVVRNPEIYSVGDRPIVPTKKSGRRAGDKEPTFPVQDLELKTDRIMDGLYNIDQSLSKLGARPTSKREKHPTSEEKRAQEQWDNDNMEYIRQRDSRRRELARLLLQRAYVGNRDTSERDAREFASHYGNRVKYDPDGDVIGSDGRLNLADQRAQQILIDGLNGGLDFDTIIDRTMKRFNVVSRY